jgi:hypothetical protein
MAQARQIVPWDKERIDYLMIKSTNKQDACNHNYFLSGNDRKVPAVRTNNALAFSVSFKSVSAQLRSRTWSCHKTDK